jgi:Fe2+ or Zn2+ uptake regulation protein
MSTSPVEQFRKFLSQRGQRLTRERAIVVDTVFQLAPPFDADLVLDAVRHKLQCLSRSTVYRTLHQLHDAGLLYMQISADQSVVFAHSREQAASSPKSAFSEICAATHSNLIAGTCPWCTMPVINGEVRDNRT